MMSAGMSPRYTARSRAIGYSMKAIVLILLAAVVVSLFSGLFFLVKDRDSPDSTRMLTSLKIRVVLSVCLVVFLVAAYLLGWISS